MCGIPKVLLKFKFYEKLQHCGKFTSQNCHGNPEGKRKRQEQSGTYPVDKGLVGQQVVVAGQVAEGLVDGDEEGDATRCHNGLLQFVSGPDQNIFKCSVQKKGQNSSETYLPNTSAPHTG